MTKIERILAAIRGQFVDKVPKGEFYLEDGLVTKLLSLHKEVGFRERVAACELLGLDALAFSPLPGQGEDVWQELEHWRDKTDFFIFAIVNGSFQATARTYPSFTEFLLDTVKHKEKALLEKAAKAADASLELGLKALERGANGIIIADDIAFQQGTFISPALLREVFFPSLKSQVAVFHDQNVPVFFHSDGNILAVLRDLQSLGFNGIHSLEPIMDIKTVREITQNELCLMGGFDLGWFAPGGSDQAKELLSKAWTGGGYIFGSSAGILDANLSAAEVLEVYRFVEKFPV